MSHFPLALHRMACVAAVIALSSRIVGQSVPVYRITDLGSLADTASDEGRSVALGINLLNEVVGQTDIGLNANNAFVWLPEDNYPGFTVGTLLPKFTMLDLGSGPFSQNDVANDISNGGNIAGMAADGSTVDKARVWDLTTGVTSTLFSRSFRIGPAADPFIIEAWSINDNATYEVAGWDHKLGRGAFVWKRTDPMSTLTYLPPLASLPYNWHAAAFGVNSVFPPGDTTKTGQANRE